MTAPSRIQIGPDGVIEGVAYYAVETVTNREADSVIVAIEYLRDRAHLEAVRTGAELPDVIQLVLKPRYLHGLIETLSAAAADLHSRAN